MREYIQIIVNDRIYYKQIYFKILQNHCRDIGQAVRVFANGPGDLGSIPGRVIPKTQKMVLDASLLNSQHYTVRIKGKVKQSREGVAPSPTSWCSSYRKGSLRVTLDYGHQLYFTFYYSCNQDLNLFPCLYKFAFFLSPCISQLSLFLCFFCRL